jgi:hypothetical protein
MLLRQMPSCCTQLVLVIYNADSAKDDNFKVILNGNEFSETIDNNANTCTGRIYATTPEIDSSNLAAIDCEDLAPTFQPTVGNMSATRDTMDSGGKFFIGDISPSAGNNLRIESIQDNNNANFGHVKVLAVQRCEEEGDWEVVTLSR